MKEKYEIIIKDSVESTNKTARELAESGKRKTVVVSLTQTGGRGRKDRTWHSPKGGLWFSVILETPSPDLQSPQLYNIVASLACQKALESRGVKSKLKWPNDLYFDGKKLGGILSEASFSEKLDYVIIGIGINCNILKDDLPDQIRETSTTTFEILNKDIELVTLLADILEIFNWMVDDLSKKGFSHMKKYWLENSLMNNTEIEIEIDGEFKKVISKGLTDQGFLIIENNGKEEVVKEGDIKV